MAKLDNFFSGNAGKTHLNPDPPNGIDGECVNAASSYSMSIGGPQFFGNGDSSTAYRIWETFNHPFYKRVTSGYQPEDIMFLSPNNPSAGTGSAGHVNMFLKSTPGGYQAVEANWNGNRGVAVNNHSFAGVVGALRPVTNNTNPGEDMVDLFTARRIKYAVHGADGRNGRPNALDGSLDNQLKSWVGRDTNEVLQQAFDDEYGKAYRADVDKAYAGGGQFEPVTDQLFKRKK